MAIDAGHVEWQPNSLVFREEGCGQRRAVWEDGLSAIYGERATFLGAECPVA